MSLKERLAREIALTGPMTVADYVTRCLHDPQGGYYATRPASCPGTPASSMRRPSKASSWR